MRSCVHGTANYLFVDVLCVQDVIKINKVDGNSMCRPVDCEK